MKKTKTIKKLLKIDMDFLCENSTINIRTSENQNESCNFLLFDLKSNFLDLFNQFKISFFQGKAQHLEFIAQEAKITKIKKIVELLVSEYGTDENNQNVNDWTTSKYMTWWFKNSNHEQIYDDPENKEKLFYGILIDGMIENQVTLAIINYSNIDSKLNTKDWLQ